MVDGDIARRFTVAGTSGRLIYDRIILRNRIVPGSGSMRPESQVAQTHLVVEGTNAQTETGLAAAAADRPWGHRPASRPHRRTSS